MTKTNLILIIAAFLTAAPMAGCLPEPVEPVTLVFVGGSFLAQPGVDPIGDAVILIEDDKIAAAGPQSHIPFPKGVETLDARGLWIVLGTNLDDRVALFPATGSEFDGPLPADLLIFDSDPRGQADAARSLRHIIRAGKVIGQPESPAGQP